MQIRVFVFLSPMRTCRAMATVARLRNSASGCSAAGPLRRRGPTCFFLPETCFPVKFMLIYAGGGPLLVVLINAPHLFCCQKKMNKI